MKSPGDIFIIMDVPTQMRGGGKATREVSSSRNKTKAERIQERYFNICLNLRFFPCTLMVDKYDHRFRGILSACLCSKIFELTSLIQSFLLLLLLCSVSSVFDFRLSTRMKIIKHF